MRSAVFSLLFCTFCIFQSYSLALPEQTPDQFKNHAACLAEQKLDLSVFGISSWKEWDEELQYFKLRKTLDENKRNILIACLYHSKPIYNVEPIIIKTKEGTYEIDPYRESGGKTRDDKWTNACIEHKHDLYKTAGCWYDLQFTPRLEEHIIEHQKKRRQ